MTTEKLCMFCNNFRIVGGCADTYGYGGEDYMTCKKDKNAFSLFGGEEQEFRDSMLFAVQCPDYKQVKA